MGYLTELVKKLSGLVLKEMKRYTLWIKPGSFYHLRVYQLKRLKDCPNLVNLDPPKQDLEPPSMTSLRTHESTFEAAKKNPEIDPEAFRKARDRFSDALRLHSNNTRAAAMKATLIPGLGPASGGGDAPPPRSSSSRPERESSSSDGTSHTEEKEDTDQTIPMEVYTSQQGGGNGHSWSDRVDDEESWGQQSSRCHKRR